MTMRAIVAMNIPAPNILKEKFRALYASIDAALNAVGRRPLSVSPDGELSMHPEINSEMERLSSIAVAQMGAAMKGWTFEQTTEMMVNGTPRGGFNFYYKARFIRL